MLKLRSLSLIFILFACISSLVSSQELIFSGFVELASTATTEETIDFSKVEVQLFTAENTIVEKTSCSQNGFFLLPIYDKKSYVLKVNPPQESTFEPESIAIDLRGKTNEEVAKIVEQSLSFKFIGFSLAGEVKIEGAAEGPAGVAVELYDSAGQKVSTTHTQQGGHFQFDRVLTGKYKIKLAGKDTGYYWNQGAGSIDCELSWKNGKTCTGSLVISSFEVKGKFASYSEVFNKQNIFLYSEDPAVRARGNLPEIKNHPLAGSGREYVSYSSIDKDGNFRFENVPRGKYQLKIQNADANSKLEIEPSVYNLVVENKPVYVENPFTVTRFSVQGNVVDQEGNGLSGIKVILDGDKTAVTDARGFYQIDKVPTGKSSLEVQDEHLFFDLINDLQLDPSVSTLPKLTLSLVHVCGEVSLKGGANDHEFDNAKIVVYLERQGEKRSSLLGKDDRYCFEVKPGRYNIYPVVMGVSAGQQETLFSPKSREVIITNKPLLDVNFYRPRLSIQGELQLLANVKPSQLAATRITLTSAANKGAQKTVNVGTDRKFSFDQILPGSYNLQIENENLCWKDENKRVELSGKNVTDVVFEQAGFAFRYQTSRPIKVRLTPTAGGSPIDTQLLPSSNSYCVEKAGSYKILPDNCYEFATSQFTVNTEDEKPVVLEPTGFLLKGEVVANKAIEKNLDSNTTLSQFIVDNIFVSLITTQRITLRLQYAKTEDNLLRFFYQYYVPGNTEVTVELKPNSKLEGKALQIVQNLMFNPTQTKFQIEDTCILDTSENKIEIRQGLIYVGSVQPNVGDWVLSVHREDTEELVESKQKTDANFKLGPYLDLYKYNITAEKEGYKFDATFKEEGYNLYRVVFHAQKLSQLRIQVLDQDKKPVPGAVIFVSSMAKKNTLKINNYTNERGIFSTNQIVKGEYFVKAVLKEYSFEPAQVTVSIEDGEHKDLSLIAKRVAYSAYGKVQTLGKSGCEGLKVTAVPQSSMVPIEIAETDAQGYYRIRGLVPGTAYTISVEKSTGEGVPQYANIRPESLLVKAQASDFIDIDFIGFERKTTSNIIGNVAFDHTYSEEDLDQIESIQVRLYKNGGEEALETANIRLFRYFEFKNVQPGDYTIKTFVKRGKNQIPTEYTQEISSSSFGEDPAVLAEVKISKNKTISSLGSAAKGSYLAPIVILIVIFLFLNMDTLSLKYKKYSENKERAAAAASNKRRN